MIDERNIAYLLRCLDPIGRYLRRTMVIGVRPKKYGVLILSCTIKQNTQHDFSKQKIESIALWLPDASLARRRPGLHLGRPVQAQSHTSLCPGTHDAGGFNTSEVFQDSPSVRLIWAIWRPSSVVLPW
jgi:hypothetical protein